MSVMKTIAYYMKDSHFIHLTASEIAWLVTGHVETGHGGNRKEPLVSAQSVASQSGVSLRTIRAAVRVERAVYEREGDDYWGEIRTAVRSFIWGGGGIHELDWMVKHVPEEQWIELLDRCGSRDAPTKSLRRMWEWYDW